MMKITVINKMSHVSIFLAFRQHLIESVFFMEKNGNFPRPCIVLQRIHKKT
jgi:hypothetical protein